MMIFLISPVVFFYFATPLPAVKDTRAVLYLCKIGNSIQSRLDAALDRKLVHEWMVCVRALVRGEIYREKRLEPQ